VARATLYGAVAQVAVLDSPSYSAALYGAVAQVAVLDSPSYSAALYGAVAQVAVLDSPSYSAALYGAVGQVAVIPPTPVAVLPDISGAPTVLATFDGSGSTAPYYYAWEWTSVPGGSAVSNGPFALPDNGATSLMVDNVALWHFSDATDSSGEGNDLTLVNSPSFVSGKIGNAIELNGSNQTAHITDASLQITGDMSLFTWVYLDTLGDQEELFACSAPWTTPEAEADNVLYMMRLSGTGGNVDYYHEYGSGSNQILAVSGLVTAGQWCHIGLVRDTTAKTVKFYRDGVLVQTSAYTHNPTGGTASPFYLGSTDGVSAFIDGKFDEFAIWSRALSPSEVVEVHHYGTTTGLLAQTATAAFTPDVAGTYTVQLEVADGVTDTAEAFISVAKRGGSRMVGGAFSGKALRSSVGRRMSFTCFGSEEDV